MLNATYAECPLLLSVTYKSFMLIVVMLSAVMVSVVAPPVLGDECHNDNEANKIFEFLVTVSAKSYHIEPLS
jgi:hypothetical protein